MYASLWAPSSGTHWDRNTQLLMATVVACPLIAPATFAGRGTLLASTTPHGRPLAPDAVDDVEDDVVFLPTAKFQLAPQLRHQDPQKSRSAVRARATQIDDQNT